MKSLRIIFVDQLSLNNPVLCDIEKDDSLLFYEPCETFYEIKHHKQKIAFLISSMRKFVQKQNHKNIIHCKINKNKKLKLGSYLKNIIEEGKFKKIIVSKPSDFKTNKDLMFFCQSNGIELEVLDDKKFISTSEDFTDWASDKKLSLIHI